MGRTDIKASRVAMNPRSMSLAALDAHDYADSFQVIVDSELPSDPTYWTEKLLQDVPPLVARMMAARNAAMKPLGLRVSGDPGALPFPKLDETEEEVLVGLDDKHLNFRASIRVEPHGTMQAVTFETVVKFNGITGRLYFLPVKPMHKYVVIPRMLEHAARVAYAEFDRAG
jgi:hypothetical protein